MTTTILKKILAAASIILIPAIAVSQETADTIPVHELNEVIVRAPKVIRKADMDVYYPSQSAVENSRNGWRSEPSKPQVSPCSSVSTDAKPLSTR